MEKIISPNVINPVDYYNQNYLEHTISLLEGLPPVVRTGKKSLSYVKNSGDEKKAMVIIDFDNNTFEAQMDNGFGMIIGRKYTPFMMLQKIIFKDSWSASYDHVVYKLMNNQSDIIRVRTDYFRVLTHTDRYGVEREVLEPWSRQAILDDHSKAFLQSVEKYKLFTIVPDNKNYSKIHKGNYNRYAKFEHKALSREEYNGETDFKWTKNLLKHMFSPEKYHLGLIYMKTLYEKPKQILPILTLISKERQTGKTTLVNYLSILFGANTIIINPQDIGNQFNGSYAHKNLVMIEESHFDSRQSMEKIKNLATQQLITVNTKYIPQYEIPFFGKLIITSNDENKFTKVEMEEIRFWICKIPTLKGKANHQILENLRDEIPAFLYFLENLYELAPECRCYLNKDGSVDTSQSRMVFKPEDIETEALTSVKLESREGLHKEVEMYLDSHCLNNEEIETFYFTAQDIKEKYFKFNNNYGVAYVNRVLKVNMDIEKSSKPIRYLPLEDGGMEIRKNGRPFIYPNPYYDPNSIKEPEIEF
jgi:hypothetical protein